jgi:hypothetical protein
MSAGSVRGSVALALLPSKAEIDETSDTFTESEDKYMPFIAESLIGPNPP